MESYTNEGSILRINYALGFDSLSQRAELRRR